jgi:hypothetical protein
MKELKIRMSDSKYYDLVALAAQEQKDVDEFAKDRLLALVSDDGEGVDDLSFREKIIEQFDLDIGTKTAANVIGVAERMREGMSWKNAYTARAQEYVSKNQDIDDSEKYSDTVRDSCTRRIGLNTSEFRQQVAGLIEDCDKTTDENDYSKTYPTERSYTPSEGYVVDVRTANDVIATFGEDPSKDQSEVMKAVVNYLIKEHDLIDRISIPYVVEKKALINDTPTYPDGTEPMRHYKELSNGYYLDTHYKKEDKRKRMQELARECGLRIKPGNKWKQG